MKVKLYVSSAEQNVKECYAVLLNEGLCINLAQRSNY